ncbi:LysE family transporter [Alkalihalophilus marmarensis]|uniref:LysE family transporter n=1 Tax=Alkalihalophilus marmarensis TaxID=521377 RepID=UPI002DBF62AD|nr:LysE family transporter [Alkalihalophilus marmarensis]MEC2074081.1 LysE family transporter [Alkalihalophilus marmarensis]
MNSILTYVVLGVSLAAPIGPVNAAQLNKGLRLGFGHAWIFGLGALLADICYMLLVYMGMIHFIDQPFMQAFLWLFGFFVLTYTGIESLVNNTKTSFVDGDRGSSTLFRSFNSGFLLSISNPLTILFWLGIYGSVLAKAASSFTTFQLGIYSLAIISGILLWDVFMATVSSVARNILNTKFLLILSLISSLSMIGFGIYFGMQAFKLLFL